MSGEDATSGLSDTELSVMSWARLERDRANWVRENGERFGINPAKYIVGQVISTVINDDMQCLDGTTSLIGNPRFIELARINRNALLERLDWESTAPEVPSQIRQVLMERKKDLEEEEWTDEEKFEAAFAKYAETLDFVREEKSKDPLLEEAVRYFQEVEIDGIVRDNFPRQS